MKSLNSTAIIHQNLSYIGTAILCIPTKLDVIAEEWAVQEDEGGEMILKALDQFSKRVKRKQTEMNIPLDRTLLIETALETAEEMKQHEDDERCRTFTPKSAELAIAQAMIWSYQTGLQQTQRMQPEAFSEENVSLLNRLRDSWKPY